MCVTNQTYHKIKVGASKRKQCRVRKMAKFVKILTVLMLRTRSLLFGLLDQQFEQARETNESFSLAGSSVRLLALAWKGYHCYAG